MGVTNPKPEQSVVARCLVVEDDLELSDAIVTAVSARVQDCRTVSTVADATRELSTWRPNLVIMDIKLPDGTTVELLESSRALKPWPTFVSMSGQADVEETFRLAQLGVRAFLAKPLDVAQLLETIDQVLSVPPEWTPVVKNMVGHGQLKDFEDEVRSTMIDEALDRTDGSRRGAAKLLSVTRQALQHMIRRRS